jgi:hypothetical protein
MKNIKWKSALVLLMEFGVAKTVRLLVEKVATVPNILEAANRA